MGLCMSVCVCLLRGVCVYLYLCVCGEGEMGGGGEGVCVCLYVCGWGGGGVGGGGWRLSTYICICLSVQASEVCDRSCNSANTKYNKKSLTRRKRRSLEPRQPQQPGRTASRHLHQSPYNSDTATHKTLKQPKINTSRQDDIFRIPLLNRATVLEAKGKKRWNNRSGSPLSGVSVPTDPANQTEKDQPWERTVAKAADSLAELSRKQNQSQSKSANGATASFLQSKYLLHARITITFA